MQRHIAWGPAVGGIAGFIALGLYGWFIAPRLTAWVASRATRLGRGGRWLGLALHNAPSTFATRAMAILSFGLAALMIYLVVQHLGRS